MQQPEEVTLFLYTTFTFDLSLSTATCRKINERWCVPAWKSKQECFRASLESNLCGRRNHQSPDFNAEKKKKAGVQFVWTLRLYSPGHMKTMTSELFDEVAVLCRAVPCELPVYVFSRKHGPTSHQHHSRNQLLVCSCNFSWADGA